MNKKSIFYKINELINNNNLLEAEKILDNMDNKDCNSKTYNSLLLRVKIKLSKLEEVDKLINNYNLMKRDYLLYINTYYNKNKEKAIYIFNEYVRFRHKLYTKEIEFLINNNFIDIVNKLNYYHVKCNYIGNTNDIPKLDESKIDKNILDNILTELKSKIGYKNYNKLHDKINSNFKYNLVVDCGNVLNSTENKNDKYKNFYKFLKNLDSKYKPLLVIHPINFKKNKLGKSNLLLVEKIKSEFKENIFITPYGFNDDIFILLSSLILNCNIVSRDKFRDHVNKLSNFKYSNTFKIFIYFKIYDYNFNGSLEKNNLPECIIINEEQIFVPCKNNKFLLVKN